MKKEILTTRKSDLGLIIFWCLLASCPRADALWCPSCLKYFLQCFIFSKLLCTFPIMHFLHFFPPLLRIVFHCETVNHDFWYFFLHPFVAKFLLVKENELWLEGQAGQFLASR